LVPAAVAALAGAGWIVSGTLVVAEVGRDEILAPGPELLADRIYGAARVGVWRFAPDDLG
jgi:hypothetical protein